MASLALVTTVVARSVRIDEPGAGAWIMERVGGFFSEGRDHAFSSHRGDQMLGGIALTDYLGGSMAMHMAGEDTRWFTRELAWLAFHYAFEQLGCHKVFGPVQSDNYRALATNLRGGWTIEAVLRGAFGDADMVVLSMTKDSCPWLNYVSREWRPALKEVA
jgi:RimJ/RimL family protein N-acetyltransferase